MTEEKKYERIADNELDGLRLDQALTLIAQDVSRTACNKRIKEGGVSVNGTIVQKPSYVVQTGDTICARISPAVEPEIEAREIPLDVLYEDDDLLVVNKPKGMVVHPAAGHYDDTLVNAVMAHCGDTLSGIGGVLRPGIVHRIDKDTSGALLVCKNDAAHLALSAQLKRHSVEREYLAIAHGLIKDDDGTVDLYIGRSATDRKKMAATTNAAKGKRAVTHYRVKARYENDRMTYVSCRLETGRTHQIRAHLASLHHPLLGDPLYGSARGNAVAREKQIEARLGEKLNGQCLHARTLAFTHPASGERIYVEAPVPPYFAKLLQVLQ